MSSDRQDPTRPPVLEPGPTLEVLDGLALRSLAPLVSGAAMVFLALAIFNIAAGSAAPGDRALQIGQALSGLALLALRVALRRHALPARWANATTLGVAGIAAANSLAAVAVSADPVLVGYSLLVVVACGAFILSGPWLLAAMGGTLAASALVLSSFLTAADFVRYGLSLLAAAGLGVLISRVRRQTVLAALESSRQEARRRHDVVESLQVSQERWRLAVEASKGGWWEAPMDPRAPLTMPRQPLISDTCLRALGYGQSELEDTSGTWRSLIEPNDLRLVEAAAESHLAQSTLLFEACYRMRSRAGEWRWIEVSGSIQRDAAGRPVLWCGLDWDVTEREIASQQFSQFKHVAVTSANPTLITDAHGMIEYANPSFTRATGYSAEEVLGKSPLMLDSEATPKETHEEAWSMITAGHDWRGVFENVRKDGSRYRVRVSISPVRSQGGVITHYLLVHEGEPGRGSAGKPGRSEVRSSALY